jgi:Flp pilus assembly protein TadG
VVRRVVPGLRERPDNETGAEMIEFAFIVVFLIGLLYGLVTIGLSLATKETITQSAADAARAGIVLSSPLAAETEAQTEALHDIGWIKGSLTCASSTVSCAESSTATCANSVTVCVNSYEAFCDSSDTTECLTVVVTYNYSNAPLIPNVPGLDVLVPSTLSSTATLQVSSATTS